MNIKKARIQDLNSISEIMLLDLKIYESHFPDELMFNFKKHAKKENLVKEFDNPDLIAFIFKKENIINGFIVGYKDKLNGSAMIHYIAGQGNEIKKELLDRFIEYCNANGIKKIITDTFEFMENNNFFKINGFLLIKKEKISSDLEMLWYELKK